MGKDIDFQVRLQLNRAADEFVKDEAKSADWAEDRFLVAFRCDGALDPEGRIIVSWRDGVREFEKMRRSAERINLVQSFTENILLVPSDELRARMNDSDELRAWLLVGLCQFFDSSKIDENFLVGQAWKAEKWLPVDDDFFCFKAYQLLRNQDQPQQTPDPAEDQEATTPLPADHEVKKDKRVIVTDQKAYSREMFPQMIELLSKGETKTSASNIVAAPFKIKGNTVEKKFNTFIADSKGATNLLKEIGREDLIETLDRLQV